mmetsp:Transcript_10851/g.19303  ORF Transcript_10851/g.19303 Transcript_10851/m.19303 type:complete len:882 (+) Transcript_10851:93-2738(+)
MKLAAIVAFLLYLLPALSVRTELQVREADQLSSFRPRQCGYNLAEAFDDKEAEEAVQNMSIYDPSVRWGKLGWGQMTASVAHYMGRVLLHKRIIALELGGHLASPLIQALYGVFTAKVPETCFQKLHDAFDNANRSMDEIKKRKASALELLKEVEKECMEANTTEAGKSAALTLMALKRGYWSLYKPLEVSQTSTLAFRNVDELRVSRGDQRLRQLWHFAKIHLLANTNFILRNAIFKAPAKTEASRLKKQLVRGELLTGFRRGILDHIEVDGKRHCILTQEQDLTDLLEAVGSRSASHRVVLVFHERMWTALAHGTRALFDHPLQLVKKFGTRWVDEFTRAPLGWKIGMVVRPVLLAAAVGGALAGIITGGQASIGYLIMQALVDSGALSAVAIAATPVVQQVLKELLSILFKPFQQVLQTHLIKYSATHIEVISRFMRYIQKKPREQAIQKVSDELEATVERILNKAELMDEIKKLRGMDEEKATDENGEDYGDILQEEARRYVENVVWESFMQEVLPALQRQIREDAFSKRTDATWTLMTDWCYFNGLGEGCTFRQAVQHEPLLNENVTLRVRKEAKKPPRSLSFGFAKSRKSPDSPQEERYSEHTFRVKSGPETLPDEYNVEFDSGASGTLKISSKDVLWVQDPNLTQTRKNWMTWPDWTEYRKGSSARSLVKKRIVFDVNLSPVCASIVEEENENDGARCLSGLSDPMGHPIVWPSVVKVPGFSRPIVVSRQTHPKFGVKSDPAQTHCTFWLTKRAKMCLFVHDPEASQRMEKDADRRARDQAWADGKLAASRSLANEVIEVLKRVKPGADPVDTSSQEAKIGQEVVHRELALESVEFALQEEVEDPQYQHEQMDEEEVTILSELQSGLRQYITEL